MMTKQMSAASNRSTESCVTPEMANKPSGEMFGKANEQCRYESFEMPGATGATQMTIKTRMVGERIGACDPPEAG